MDYFVKLQVPRHNPPIDDGDYDFPTSHYSGELSDTKAFQKNLEEGVWRVGFTPDEWCHATKIWIFGCLYCYEKGGMQ
jgi:hypothetical protein